VNRNAVRGRYPHDVRISQLESDADEFESGIALIKNLLVGILVSTTTGAILLAINVLVARGGA
jgi:hypothetical protein